MLRRPNVHQYDATEVTACVCQARCVLHSSITFGIAFGCETKLLSTILVDLMHERVGININFLLLVFLSFPTPLQHPHAVVLAP